MNALSPINYRLSPSDFAFLWEECKLCFYLKVAKKFFRPRTVMPKIFTVIDAEMKAFFAGKRLHEIIPDFPPGVVEYSEHWVESEPVAFEEFHATCFIRGKFDTAVKFDDGSYGVIDFKSSQRTSEHLPLYARQLHAYAYALEHATPGNLTLSPIRTLGLLVYEPESFSVTDKTLASLTGKLAWIEIPRDDKAFIRFLYDVLSLLESKNVPLPSPTCGWCQYRRASRKTNL